MPAGKQARWRALRSYPWPRRASSWPSSGGARSRIAVAAAAELLAQRPQGRLGASGGQPVRAAKMACCFMLPAPGVGRHSRLGRPAAVLHVPIGDLAGLVEGRRRGAKFGDAVDSFRAFRPSWPLPGPRAGRPGRVPPELRRTTVHSLPLTATCVPDHPAPTIPDLPQFLAPTRCVSLPHHVHASCPGASFLPIPPARPSARERASQLTG